MMPYIADGQICLDEARKMVVPCDSPEARSNLALPGALVSDEDVKKYGIGGLAKAPAPEAEPAVADEDEEEDAEAKTDAPSPVQEKTVQSAPANKAKNGSANK